MGFGQAVESCFSQYATFRGRACRSEYWHFALFGALASIFWEIAFVVAGFGDPVATSTAAGLLSVLLAGYSLTMFLPTLSVTVRRLHDTGRSGWWWLIGIVPLIGAILLLVWFCSRGTYGPNRYGADPLAR